jgi:hypothetical protein
MWGYMYPDCIICHSSLSSFSVWFLSPQQDVKFHLRTLWVLQVPWGQISAVGHCFYTLKQTLPRTNPTTYNSLQRPVLVDHSVWSINHNQGRSHNTPPTKSQPSHKPNAQNHLGCLSMMLKNHSVNCRSCASAVCNNRVTQLNAQNHCGGLSVVLKNSHCQATESNN